MIIYNNNLFIYDQKHRLLEKHLNQDAILRDDKLSNPVAFSQLIQNSKIIKQISRRITPTDILIFKWGNYLPSDEKILNDFFNSYNVNHLYYKDISTILPANNPTLVLSADGIHYCAARYCYYSYETTSFNLLEAIEYITKKNNLKKYIILGTKRDLTIVHNQYYFENNDTFFEDLLKNYDLLA